MASVKLNFESIIIANDNKRLLEVMYVAIHSICPNTEIVKATCGYEAVTALKQVCLDNNSSGAEHLLVIDMQMPYYPDWSVNMDCGYNVLEELQSSGLCCPVVIVSFDQVLDELAKNIYEPYAGSIRFRANKEEDILRRELVNKDFDKERYIMENTFKRVLVVDDRRDKRDTIVDVMRYLYPQAKIEQFVCINEILRAVYKASEDSSLHDFETLVVSDVQMPRFAGDRIEIDAGYEVLKRMQIKGIKYPAILVSSESVEDNKATALYDGYLGSILYSGYNTTAEQYSSVINKFFEGRKRDGVNN